MATLLEILKFTIPALIVFLTVYYLFKTYLSGQLQLKQMEIRQQEGNEVLPLKLQAYERFSLLCERISIPNLIVRTRREGMTAREMKLAMLLAIQQEFEHNITQQVYVSAQLWEILKAAREDAVSMITLAAERVGETTDARAFANTLLAMTDERGGTGTDKALMAIKREASLILGR